MASLAKIARTNVLAVCRTSSLCTSQCAFRSLSTKVDATESEAEKKGWLSRLLPVRQIDPGKESHSSQLSDKDTVYELQIHGVNPANMDEYIHRFGDYVDMVDRKKSGASLVGSWTVEIGDQDEAIHIWAYKGGYPTLNNARKIYRTDKDFLEFRKKRNQILRYRKNQILLAFSFWGPILPRDDPHIYELRSYVLKPGTMIEWGNNWSRGIKARQAMNEPVAGFFSHIGQLYLCHHLWAYKDLQTRKEVRDSAWSRPGWDQCVAYTVPLIKQMESRILIATPFSPLK